MTRNAVNGTNRTSGRPRTYIGISCTIHDPALSIVNEEGEILFAEATERRLQYKRAMNCLADDPVFCQKLLKKHCDPDSEIVLALNWSRRGRMIARTGDKLRSMVSLVGRRGRPAVRLMDLFRFVLRSQSGLWRMVGESLRYSSAFPDSPLVHSNRPITVRWMNHHLCHAAAGCYTSPFDEAVCAVIDGFGDDSSTASYHFRDGKLKLLRRSKSSFASLGMFYSALCVACGFGWVEGEEWKVMGMAPYGKFNKDLYDRMINLQVVDGLRIRRPLKKVNSFWRQDHTGYREDLAHTGQVVYEDMLMKLLSNLAATGHSKNLVLMGGCGLNSTANGLILERTPFEQLHVYAAPADDGTALGAALLAWHGDHPYKPLPARPVSPYLGDGITEEKLAHVTGFSNPEKVRYCGERIVDEAASLLAAGKIIGWMQGRAEFGPRALGNRSILANPCDPGIKDIINARVKFREEFRPFAPSILHEFGPEYFENYQESPYMERTLRFRDEVVDKVPGVVHVNQSGRLQTVKREWNPRYHALIDAFRQRTGVPLVLNTSFNVMGKPIVHSVEDALACLHTTGLDAVAINDYLFLK